MGAVPLTSSGCVRRAAAGDVAPGVEEQLEVEAQVGRCRGRELERRSPRPRSNRASRPRSRPPPPCGPGAGTSSCAECYGPARPSRWPESCRYPGRSYRGARPAPGARLHRDAVRNHAADHARAPAQRHQRAAEGRHAADAHVPGHRRDRHRPVPDRRPAERGRQAQLQRLRRHRLRPVHERDPALARRWLVLRAVPARRSVPHPDGRRAVSAQHPAAD